MRKYLVALLVLVGATGCAGPRIAPLDLSNVQWIAQDSGTAASFRGLCAVSDLVAWTSGAGGTVLRTVDGGQSWTRLPIRHDGADALDYRDVHAFDADHAVVMSAGLPARFYHTGDGGTIWTEAYRNDAEGVFFDAMAFWDDTHGLAFSDPVGGRLLIIATGDGGRSWSEVEFTGMPAALDGEGGFAASGTCLAVATGNDGNRHAWIGLGGDTGAGGARLFHSGDGGRAWNVIESPLRADASSGIFSIAFEDSLQGVMVGGDYQQLDARKSHAATTHDGGRLWTTMAEEVSPRGYRSVVCWLPHERAFVAGGPGGVDFSLDHGRTWAALSDEGFHVMSVTPEGDAIWAAGSDGRIARLERRP